jgi:hypothetical protein
VDALVKWLEVIWFDPEVQRTIDEKAWRTLIESLEEFARDSQK